MEAMYMKQTIYIEYLLGCTTLRLVQIKYKEQKLWQLIYLDRWRTEAHNRVAAMTLDKIWLRTAKSSQFRDGPSDWPSGKRVSWTLDSSWKDLEV
jgi:hypothetical protein